MDIRKTLTLRGPNIWGLKPALEIWFGGLDEVSPDAAARVVELVEQWCLAAGRAAHADAAREWTRSLLAHEARRSRLFATLLIELQRTFGAHQALASQSAWNEVEQCTQVAVEYRHEDLAKACLEWAVDLLRAAEEGTEFSVVPRWLELCRVCESKRVPASIDAVLEAAADRDIPLLPTADAEIWQLGWGGRGQRVSGLLTARSSAVAEKSLRDPNVVWKYLQAAGAPMFDPDESLPAATLVALVAHHRLAGIVQVSSSEAGATHVEYAGPVAADVVTQLVEAAHMLGLEIAEFELAGPDLAEALDGTTRGVVRVSSQPNLDRYARLPGDVARRLARQLVDGLFAAEQNGRIPVIAVTGVNGKTTTTRLCAHIVSQTGKRVGMTCTDGIYVNGRRIDTEDCSGPKSARGVLLNPTLDAAVLETARGGILREGLAFDRCDVAVVTNIGEGDHLGLGGVHTLEQLARVKRTIVDAVGPQGAAVLKADDPLTAGMAAHCRGAVVFFCRDGNHPVIVEHRAKGGRVVFARDNSVVVADGHMEIPLLSFERIPLTHNGRILFQVENVLAATAANWALGIPAQVIRIGLETFSATLDKSPGRFNLLDICGATVVVDYGHNTSSLQAMLETLAQFPQQRRLAVYSAAGDRRDCDMIEQGRLLGQAFDQVILYEDHYLRGRSAGDISRLFEQGLQQGGRVQSVRSVQGWDNAVAAILEVIGPGDLVLLQADTIDGAVDIIRSHLVTQVAAREVNLREALSGTGSTAALAKPAQS